MICRTNRFYMLTISYRWSNIRIKILSQIFSHRIILHVHAVKVGNFLLKKKKRDAHNRIVLFTQSAIFVFFSHYFENLYSKITQRMLQVVLINFIYPNMKLQAKNLRRHISNTIKIIFNNGSEPTESRWFNLHNTAISFDVLIVTSTKTCIAKIIVCEWRPEKLLAVRRFATYWILKTSHLACPLAVLRLRSFHAFTRIRSFSRFSMTFAAWLFRNFQVSCPSPWTYEI